MLSRNLIKLTVKDVLTGAALTTKEDITLRESLQLMSQNDASEIIVVNKDNVLQGVLTLVGASKVIASLKDSETCLRKGIFSLMQKELLAVEHNAEAIETAVLMESRDKDLAVVLEKGKFAGLIRKTDLFRQVYSCRVKSLLGILNALHEAVCVIDKEGMVVLWTKGSEKLFEVKAEQIIGQKLESFFSNALLLKALAEKKEMKNFYHNPGDDSYIVISAIPLFVGEALVGAVSTDKNVEEITNLIFELEETKGKLKQLQEEIGLNAAGSDSFSRVLGKSNIIKEEIARARQVAGTRASVLIVGESGTGKEIFAEAIHKESGRKGPFVAVNCSAIPESLFESEMFGYVGGAFTGALKKGKMGKFELAVGGTVFFDEIGDMPLAMQAKILRVLQERKILRVGAEKFTSVEVRVLSATHRDLNQMVAQGKFREDLYYRLNVVKIELPPLRERKKDIPLLAKFFIEEFCQENNIALPELTPEVLAVLMRYDWKGNIRELRNTVEHLVIFSKKGRIELSSLPQFLFTRLPKTAYDSDKEGFFDLESCVSRTEIDIIERALTMTAGNKSRAAKILNIPRSTLYYKIKYHGIKRGD